MWEMILLLPKLAASLLSIGFVESVVVVYGAYLSSILMRSIADRIT